MARQLTPEKIVTLHVLKDTGQSNTPIAHTLGVTEGTVRYQLRRQGQPDGRQHKPRKADALAATIAHWVQRHQPSGQKRPVNIHALYDWLRSEHGYAGSYKSVLRFVRARYPQPRLRPFRRVETPPGAQAQVDWGEFSAIDLGDGPQTLYAFVLVLSHSRKEAVIGCRRGSVQNHAHIGDT